MTPGCTVYICSPRQNGVRQLVELQTERIMAVKEPFPGLILECCMSKSTFRALVLIQAQLLRELGHHRYHRRGACFCRAHIDQPLLCRMQPAESALRAVETAAEVHHKEHPQTQAIAITAQRDHEVLAARP